MKRLILLLLITDCIFSNELFAQKNQVVYDFNKKTITYPIVGSGKKASELNFVEYKKPATFKIENINTLLYDITIKGENIELNSETPSVFKLFFNTEKFSADKNDEKADTVTKTFAKGAKENIEGYMKKVNKTIDAVESLEKTKDVYDNIYLVAYTDGKDYNTINLEMRAIMLEFDTTKDISKAKIIIKCKKMLEVYTKSFTEVEALYSTLTPDEQKSIKDEYQKIIALNKKVEKFNYEELFQKIAVLYEKATDPNTFSYTSSPVIAEKDYINYVLEIKPKKDLKFTQPEREEKFEVPVFIKGGAKIDFSTGIFFASNHISDAKYHTESITNDTINKTIIKDKNRNLFSPALGALMHVSGRGPKNFHCGLSLGLGLNSTNLTDAVYCMGLSAIIGNEERFIITVGGIGKQRNDLKGKYSNNGTVKIADIKSDDELLEKTFKAGVFVGITYNLTNKKKGQ